MQYYICFFFALAEFKLAIYIYIIIVHIIYYIVIFDCGVGTNIMTILIFNDRTFIIIIVGRRSVEIIAKRSKSIWSKI